jgi:hypothetical protein
MARTPKFPRAPFGHGHFVKDKNGNIIEPKHPEQTEQQIEQDQRFEALRNMLRGRMDEARKVADNRSQVAEDLKVIIKKKDKEIAELKTKLYDMTEQLKSAKKEIEELREEQRDQGRELDL